MNATTLISVADLAQHLDDPSCVIFDCRHDLAHPQHGTSAYAESHIRNARFAHVDRDLSGPMNGKNGRHPLPDIGTISRWLGAMGVGPDTQVVGYDDAGGIYGARLWWLLRWLGHRRVAVLDGGWPAWLQAGQAVTRDVPAPRPAQFRGTPGASAVDANHVLQHLGSRAMLLIDARSNDRFHGQNETLDPVAGHIPGASNRFFKANLDEQGRFKSATQLRAEFAELIGDVPPGSVVHQCGSGITACHNLLAMEIAELAGARIYPGSWSEWIADPARPVAR